MATNKTYYQSKRTLLSCVFVMLLSFGVNDRVFAVESDSINLDLVRSAYTRFTNWTSGLTGVFRPLDSMEKVGNINNQESALMVLEVGFKQFNYASDAFDRVGTAYSEAEDENVEPAVIGMPLVYPNPFRQSTDNGGILSYFLSKDFDVEIHIYDMLAQRVFKQTFEQGAFGARKGENRVRINRESLLGYELPSGVYFYVLIHSNSVLAKGKMVVKP